MNDSILNTIKKMLGLDASYTAFDQDIIIHINSIIMALRQMGIGPSTGFSITGSTETWANYIGSTNIGLYQGIKSYIYLKIKPVFDPSTSSVDSAADRMASEMEWRLHLQSEGAFDD